MFLSQIIIPTVTLYLLISSEVSLFISPVVYGIPSHFIFLYIFCHSLQFITIFPVTVHHCISSIKYQVTNPRDLNWSALAISACLLLCYNKSENKFLLFYVFTYESMSINTAVCLSVYHKFCPKFFTNLDFQ